MSSPLFQRWQSEEPQSFIILTLTLTALFLAPWNGCNPQRNFKQSDAHKQDQLLEARVLARPPATPAPKLKADPKPPAKH
jgi:hypothetical protein